MTRASTRARVLRGIGIGCGLWLALATAFHGVLSVFPVTESTPEGVQLVLLPMVILGMLGSVAAATFLVVVHHRRFDRAVPWVALLAICVVSHGLNMAWMAEPDSRSALPAFLYGLSWWALFVAFLIACVRRDPGAAVLGGFFAGFPWLLALLGSSVDLAAYIHPEDLTQPLTPTESWMMLPGMFFLAYAPMALVSFLVHTAVALYREFFGIPPGSMDPRKRVLDAGRLNAPTRDAPSASSPRTPPVPR